MQCFTCTDEQCQYGEVQLVDGNSTFDGHIEICLEHQWYRLCADDLTTEDVEVACRHLGFTTGGQIDSHISV